MVAKTEAVVENTNETITGACSNGYDAGLQNLAVRVRILPPLPMLLLFSFKFDTIMLDPSKAGLTKLESLVNWLVG